MKILQGHQFFPAEILPVLEAARTESYKRYIDEDNPAWLKVNVLVARMKMRFNKLADAAETSQGLTVSIRPGHPAWDELNEVLAPFGKIHGVLTMIQALPRDYMPPTVTVPGWVVPLATATGFAVVFSLAYWWLKRKKQ